MSNEQTGYPGAPPGWYPDPAGGPGQRWWDGYAWNEATILPQQAAPSPWATAPPPWAVASQGLATYNTDALVTNELHIVPIARVAIAVPALYYAVNLISQRVNSAQLLMTGRQLRQAYDAARNGTAAPPVTTHSNLGSATLLVLVLTLAAVVVACIWQHRAASAARALGLSATHSPAWGVGSWFVPIVNLWMPYQAIRDCLPPDDTGRPLVLQWWLALMGAWSLSVLAEILSFFSSGAGLGVAIPAALFCLLLLATAPRVVTSIATAHRAAPTSVEQSSSAIG